MRQHSGVFVSGIIRSSSFHPSEKQLVRRLDNIPSSTELEEAKPYQWVVLATKEASVFHLPFGAR
ncbi:hypothetical protein E2979_22265 [Paracoccus yeei]